MSVRAKFFVKEIIKSANGNRVVLGAATRGDRNRDWAKYTPSGEFNMTVTNPAAFAFFEDILDSRPEGFYPEVMITIERSFDGFPGDGHQFNPSSAIEGENHFGECVECGQQRDKHTTG